MHHHSHRHDDCCESSERCCPPPISWPQRPSFSGFPMFWPIPLPIPMLPSFGPWGGMRSSYEDYSPRRHEMYRCGCCERCGEYECRCERRCCERCGEYNCRCERRCERCGQRECRCGGHGRLRAIELIVNVGGNKIDYAISIDKQCISSNVLPQVTDLVGAKDSAHVIAAPVVHAVPDTVKIIVALDARGKIDPDTYSARIFDRNQTVPVIIANLTLHIF